MIKRQFKEGCYDLLNFLQFWHFIHCFHGNGWKNEKVII